MLCEPLDILLNLSTVILMLDAMNKNTTIPDVETYLNQTAVLQTNLYLIQNIVCD